MRENKVLHVYYGERLVGTMALTESKKAAGITGYNVSDIEALNYVGQNTKIKIGELLFAGIIISALGAVMDVGMSIASTIQEIYETDKALSMKRLFVSGINVGDNCDSPKHRSA